MKGILAAIASIARPAPTAARDIEAKPVEVPELRGRAIVGIEGR